ncbi:MULTISPECIES: NAD(P)-dependent alcohol dehydrogenase [Microbacterium]|jgi:NAD+-dependent secondary alcohol dehydrogenase Adh1|uniref:NAD(P)-dependent alcohol dehydrogenase n=1 Tax=unclassified Microbacterium TaxID=2609290 RepID=UPI0003A106A2|nr:NAD(P)-dependent alcohol dehydrogenase [Microbacterium sp. J1-1]MBS0661566.1 NAD(P)-dependent alcohol dehydrogenase [Verrucomicrobiota bacterium]UUE19479.1 NAD(P)-dependent alcohol dehydrogenase [Microbacterium sp. J1-1]
MRAVRLHQYGQAPTIDEVAEPRPLGPWDVVIDVGAAGLCRTDLHIIEGQWEPIQHPRLPYTLGHENAGWVRAIGSAVTNVEVGDTVIAHPLTSCGLCPACRVGQDSHCENATFPGVNVDGGMADQLLTNARAVVKLDPSLQPRDIAALADAGLTAYHAVRKAAEVLYPGTHAVVIGAGGLGHIGVQALAAITGAEITVVDRSEEALALAATLGAHHTVLAADDDTVAREVLEITGGGAQVVFDYVGEHGTELLSPRLLRGRGSQYVIGYGGEVRLPTIDIISREINVIGNLVGTYNDLVELMTLTAQGKVTLHTKVYPLDAALDAIADLDAGRLVGRGILVP